MKRLAFALVLAVTVASTGCLSFAQGLLEGASSSSSSSDASADCHVARDACEDFVATLCDRVEQCGGDFDKCLDLELAQFPCERAETADDLSTCLDDLGSADCTDLKNGAAPGSCQGVGISFSDTQICR